MRNIEIDTFMQEAKASNTPVVCIFIGYPGSGKSLKARRLKRQYGGVIISHDAISKAVEGDDFYNDDHKNLYTNMADEVINHALINNENVYIDRTNVDRKRRARYIEKARWRNAKIVAMVFPDSDVARRMKQPRSRTLDYWQKVMEKMAADYEAPAIEEGFDKIFTMPSSFNIFAIDFDRTIASVDESYKIIGLERFDHVEQMKFAGEKDSAEYRTIIPTMREVWRDQSNLIIIWTVRHGDSLLPVHSFLHENRIPYDWVNENPLQMYGSGPGSKKIYADRYIDDKAPGSIKWFLTKPAQVLNLIGERR
jgi:predicted kinase